MPLDARIAMSGTSPEIDGIGAFQRGAANQQAIQANQLEQAQKGIGIIGSAALAAMGGDLNGQVDPQKFDQVLNDLAAAGVRQAEMFRGKPETAPLIARLSLGTMGQISAAKNEQEYQLALQKYGLEMQKLAAGVDKTSLQGVWGTDAQGKNVYLQPTTSGKFVQAQAPEGVTLTPGIKTVDQATGTAIIDAKSGQGQGFIPKDIAGAESAKAVGKSQGEALSNLPTDIKNADETVSQIDQLLANPGLDAIVGTVDQYRPAWTLGTEGKDALARYNQLKGRAFLQAYGILRGGGQITEVEGAKAQDAMARMDRAQDESTFRTALEDFRDAVKTGVEKMRERAGQVTAPQGDVQGDQPKAAVRKTINGVTYEQDQNGDWYEAE
jgi:hypothetical protein